MSDYRSQFMSRIWKAFYECLGINVSLGYLAIIRIQWPGGEAKSRTRLLSQSLMQSGTTQVEWVPPMGRIHSELPHSLIHRPHSFHFVVLLTLFVPLVRWALWRPGCWWLVPKEQRCMFATNSLFVDKGYKQIAIDVRIQNTNWESASFWSSTKNLKLKLPCIQLRRYIGPCKIVWQINPVSYRLQLPPDYGISPSFHTSLLKPAHASTRSKNPDTMAPPTQEIEYMKFWTPGGEDTSDIW